MALADTLIIELGAVADVLEWTSSTAQITRSVTRATALAEAAADIEPLAIYFAWGYALTGLSTLYDYSADKASYKMSQMFENAKAAHARAQIDAGAYLPAGAVIGAFGVAVDPYAEADSTDEFSS